jgi:hypothetical protein
VHHVVAEEAQRESPTPVLPRDSIGMMQGQHVEKKSNT